MRCVAVDWSGAARGAHRKIWTAEVEDGQLLALTSGRSRKEVIRYLIEQATRRSDLVVGLDFAFSLPAWFLKARDLEAARELWEAARDRGEKWLDQCAPPFWGRPGTSKPDLPAHFRVTENRVREVTGSQPKSPFQIGGAGAVGTGSIRGMPHLLEVDRGGFSIWPFDEPQFPLVVEIYPRLLTGPVVKSDRSSRRAYLQRHHPDLPADQRQTIAKSDDAFDAAVSALVLSENERALRALDRPETSTVRQKEGAIWWPGRAQA